MSPNLIQWNCRGYYANYENLLVLLKEHRPHCVALQETMQNNNTIKPPKGYCIYSTANQQNTAGQGLAILVRNDVPSRKIDIPQNTTSIAVSIKFNTIVTVCNTYVSPRDQIRPADMRRLLESLPEPLIILGDFNARHPMWGDTCGLLGRGRDSAP